MLPWQRIICCVLTTLKTNFQQLVLSQYINMDKPLSQEDITAMERQLKQNVEEDRAYWRVNNVKCDAIYTAKTYEEFADRVAAAHLRPLEKNDFSNKASGWNQYATKKHEE